MLRRFRRRHGVKPKTVGGDAGYEAGAFLHEVEQELQITPHVPITSQRVTSASEGGEARRRMLRRMKTLGYQISQRDRKSTRLNSSHVAISYAVFCLKKKNLRAHG